MDVEQIVRGENALLGDFTNALSAKVEQAIHDSMQSSDRSLYAAGQRIGVSDIGTCREYVRRMIPDRDDPQGLSRRVRDAARLPEMWGGDVDRPNVWTVGLSPERRQGRDRDSVRRRGVAVVPLLAHLRRLRREPTPADR